MIHWCGTGLSAIPGLRRLIDDGRDVVVWNRSVAKAQESVGDFATDIRAFSLDAVSEALQPGDILVSMLPGDWHVPLAEACIAARANFVCSSYIAPEMRALDEAAREAGVALVNEVGLDPGIDHLMAHWLVSDYRASTACDPSNSLSFISYCGGIPKIPNEFRYKFSWSPAGVLKALRSPSRSLSGGKQLEVARPWDAISTYQAPVDPPETFEVYPNRDSLPFIKDYHFDPAWNVDTFVRGTLRLDGWKKAWKGIFSAIESFQGPEGDAALNDLSEKLWAENAYDDGEPDRVVLCVGLKAVRDSKTVYDKTCVLDAWGDNRGSAMARLVSVTVALAVASVAEGKILAGVSPAPGSELLVREWLEVLRGEAQNLSVVDGTA